MVILALVKRSHTVASLCMINQASSTRLTSMSQLQTNRVQHQLSSRPEQASNKPTRTWESKRWPITSCSLLCEIKPKRKHSFRLNWCNRPQTTQFCMMRTRTCKCKSLTTFRSKTLPWKRKKRASRNSYHLSVPSKKRRIWISAYCLNWSRPGKKRTYFKR